MGLAVIEHSRDRLIIIFALGVEVDFVHVSNQVRFLGDLVKSIHVSQTAHSLEARNYALTKLFPGKESMFDRKVQNSLKGGSNNDRNIVALRILILIIPTDSIFLLHEGRYAQSKLINIDKQIIFLDKRSKNRRVYPSIFFVLWLVLFDRTDLQVFI